jgi:aspartyl-tRNA(Asn)/glutamyl-tRNA(Gln) amidotransferase subunit B
VAIGDADSEWELVVGLECHVQLLTASKLFSPARNRYGDEPNTNVDVVDVGLPGVLPVLNGKAVELAVRLGLALGCDIRRTSVFARKHYFYPDLPKGYQVSQFEEPICEGGSLVIDTDDGEKTIQLTRIHMEEDAGKSMHDGHEDASFVDYNRAGTPLLEVVSEPDIRSAEEAMAYLRGLRTLVMYLGVCDGNMQEGSLRADANVSVRKKGDAELGQRTELKNLNSARFLGQAIDAEARRQVHELEAGRKIVQETRLWDPDKKESRAMRTKEDAHDYRYFPDPDLMPVVVSEEAIAHAEAQLPELPREKSARYEHKLGLKAGDAKQLASDKALADYFEAALALHDNATAVANWILNEVLRVVTEKKGGDDTSVESAGIPAAAIAGLVRLIDDGTITGKIAKQVFAELAAGAGDDPAKIVEEKGWKVERDTGALSAIIDELIAANDKQVAQYRAGKGKVLGFFVGQVMKKTQGKADPAEVNRLLKEKLGEPG